MVESEHSRGKIRVIDAFVLYLCEQVLISLWFASEDRVSSCSNTVSIRDDPYWTSKKNSLELIELSSINNVSLVQVSSCSNTVSIRDDPYWTSKKNSLELIELSSINKVSLV